MPPGKGYRRGPSSKKAKKILRHGRVRGKKLSAKQKRFMGARAGRGK
jgi:hypothetical protein